MVYVEDPSWHNPYAMKLWISCANKGFDGGLLQNHKCWVSNYMGVGIESCQWWEAGWRN